jgi:hypothetical protein
MSRGYPSMTALLALLAMAGYQNRDKLTEWMRGAQRSPGGPQQSPQSGPGALPPGNLGSILSGTSIGGLLGDGLRELMNVLKRRGRGRSPIRGSRVDQISRFHLHSWNR